MVDNNDNMITIIRIRISILKMTEQWFEDDLIITVFIHKIARYKTNCAITGHCKKGEKLYNYIKRKC